MSLRARRLSSASTVLLVATLLGSAGRSPAGQTLQAPQAADPTQSPPSLVLPEYTTQERWNRSAGPAGTVAAIRLSKMTGGTAVTHGQFQVGVFVSGWGAPNSGTPFGFVRSVHRNLMTNPRMQFEVISASATAVEGRFSRPWAEAFGTTRTLYGVTLEEYEDAGRTFNTLMAGYLGLDWTQRTEGDWIVFSVKRRPAPASPFPAGAYTTTITAEESRGIASIAGVWRVVFADGRYSVTRDGQPVEDGAYAVAGDLITFSQPAGPQRCAGGATYRWNAAAGQLSLERLAELCSGRPIVFSTHSMAPAR